MSGLVVDTRCTHPNDEILKRICADERNCDLSNLQPDAFFESQHTVLLTISEVTKNTVSLCDIGRLSNNYELKEVLLSWLALTVERLELNNTF
uniref:Uncharacterized protein n=1 Tax=Syphacia muris TaxID=451379 RepID=A0A0N5APZ0_9BILA